MTTPDTNPNTTGDAADAADDSMETQHEAIERLKGEGYDAEFRIDEDGTVTDGSSSWDAEAVTVEQVVRFEGQSNPDDSAMLLALEVADGPNGLLTMPYGPDLSGPQADTVQKLSIDSAEKRR